MRHPPDCPAFADITFWLPQRDSNGNRTGPEHWKKDLVDWFGNSHAADTAMRDPIEIVLPVLDDSALVLAAVETFEEMTLSLRQNGQDDAVLGWHDCHGHPMCLRPHEALLLSRSIAAQNNWDSVALPYLLLHPFVGLTNLVDAKRALEHKTSALVDLGALSDATLTPTTTTPLDTVSQDVGYVRESYLCANHHILQATAHTGIAWEQDPSGRWDLVATRRWENVSALYGMDWPVPCNTIRAQDRLRHFPQAEARMAEIPHDEDGPLFPHDRFADLILRLTE